MTFIAFIIQAVVISLSGVMAPGPVSTLAIGKGSQSPHAGVLVAIGHGLIEFPLMVAVFFGVGELLELPFVRPGIGLAGGLFLLWMSFDMIRGLRSDQLSQPGTGHSPVMGGFLLSVGSPYFLVWWATVGAALVIRSVEFGIWGFVAFAVAHWLCDLFWDAFLSVLSYKGGQFFGRGFQRIVFGVSAAALLYFGVKLILDATNGIVV